MEILLPVIIVAVIGLIAAIGLSLASKFMAVPVDETQEKLREALPGANCGACGYSGCDGYAAALANGEAKPDGCTAGGASTAEAISKILGIEVKVEPKVAFIACNGNNEISKLKYEYDGMKSCSAASLLHAGPLDCKFGCVGFGDCAKACVFGAITVENGKPIVCEELCVGCGTCVKACPKGTVVLVPKEHKNLVACSNKLKGAAVVKGCEVSCIACGMCVKQCDKGAISIVDNLAVIDQALCDGCGKCKSACKRGVLI
ncbi:MAG: RnfABCDGE type electron transport complex subunit B [Ruminococcaceae bacterium]|nr:RnfABCDGE type electron transport complex subunit B [Oscillospiraceae bacterium]